MNAKSNLTKARTAAGLVLATLLAFATSAAPAAAQGISFVQPLETPLTFPTTGTGPIGIARSDFNNDGILDLAVTQQTVVPGVGLRGFLSIMLGNGDGTFQPSIDIPLPTSPVAFGYGIIARDFNGDGKMDVAVASFELRQVLYFQGNGDGTFAAPVATTLTHRPVGLQVADLNGDGKLDLVTVNPSDNSVSVLLGNGDGTFQSPTNYAVGSNPLDLAIGDVDGTNGPDLVVGNNGSATVSVLLNNGNGTFGASTSFNARLRPLGLYLADFDGDGKLDVVAAGNECAALQGTIDPNGCMVFMKGQGNGTFAVPTDQNFTALDSPPTAHLWTENVAPDVNGDGKPDVLFVPSQAGGFGKSVVAVGLNTGDGTGRFRVSYWVGGPAQPTPGANPDFVQGVAAVLADFNNDGVLDLAYAIQGKDNTRGAVSILLGDTPGTFKVPRSYSTFATHFGNDGNPGPTPQGGVFGDFTSRGKVDLAVLASGGCPENHPLIEVFLGNGDGSLGDPIAATPIPACHGGDSTLRSADLANNGTLDLLFLGFASDIGQNQGVVASGNGNGTFTLFSSFPIGAGQQGLNMVVGDFNGDGFPDVAVYGCGGPTSNIEIFLQGAGGTKTFAIKSLLPVNPISPCIGTAGMVAADFDKDGKVDLVAQIATNFNAFFKGRGDGTFEDPTVVGTGLPKILDYVAADVNNDGNLDLIGIGGDAVWVQLGNGDGTFQPPVPYDFGTSAFGGSCSDFCAVRVADFDGDGNLDIAVAARSPFAGFAVLRNKGDGTFEPPVKFAVGATATSWLDIADVNGDGLPDVVIGHAGQNGNHYTVLLNNSLAMTPQPR